MPKPAIRDPVPMFASTTNTDTRCSPGSGAQVNGRDAGAGNGDIMAVGVVNVPEAVRIVTQAEILPYPSPRVLLAVAQRPETFIQHDRHVEDQLLPSAEAAVEAMDTVADHEEGAILLETASLGTDIGDRSRWA